jgi:hypothetical protein
MLRAAPPVLLTVIVAFLVVVLAGLVVIDGVGAEMPTTACTAVPVMLKNANPLLALLTMPKVPVRLLEPVLAFPIVGVKFTVTVQVSVGCRVLFAQPSVPLLKLVPSTASLLIVSAAAPEFVTVTVSGTSVPTGCEPNATGFGFTDTVPRAPCPARATACGLPAALSFRVNVPVRARVLVPGVNRTVIVHVEPALTVVPEQPSDTMENVVDPVRTAELKVTDAPATVPTIARSLVVPTVTKPKLAGDGAKVTVPCAALTSSAPMS